MSAGTSGASREPLTESRGPVTAATRWPGLVDGPADGPVDGPGNAGTGPGSADGSWTGLSTRASGPGLGDAGEGGAWYASNGCDSAADVLGPPLLLRSCSLAAVLSSLLASVLLPLAVRSAKRKDGSLDELWLWRCECGFGICGAGAGARGTEVVVGGFCCCCCCCVCSCCCWTWC